MYGSETGLHRSEMDLYRSEMDLYRYNPVPERCVLSPERCRLAAEPYEYPWECGGGVLTPSRFARLPYCTCTSP